MTALDIRSTLLLVVTLTMDGAVLTAVVHGGDTVVAVDWVAVAIVTSEDALRLDGTSAGMMTAGVSGGVAYSQSACFSDCRKSEPASGEGDDDGQYFSHGLNSGFWFPGAEQCDEAYSDFIQRNFLWWCRFRVERSFQKGADIIMNVS